MAELSDAVWPRVVPARRSSARERRIERYLLRQCRRRHYLCWKFTSPARDGVPDRVVITPVLTGFVEVKRTGERPRRLQVARIERMRRAGAHVWVVDSLADVDQLITHLEGLSTPTDHNLTRETAHV